MCLKEMLHSQPTRPNWFISHTWSDSVIAFVERCDKHAHSYCTTWPPGPEPDFDEEKFYNIRFGFVHFQIISMTWPLNLWVL